MKMFLLWWNAVGIIWGLSGHFQLPSLLPPHPSDASLGAGLVFQGYLVSETCRGKLPTETVCVAELGPKKLFKLLTSLLFRGNKAVQMKPEISICWETAFVLQEQNLGQVFDPTRKR